MTVKPSCVVIDGIDDKGTGARKRRDFLSVPDGVFGQGRAKSDALVLLVDPQHAEEDSGDLSRAVADKPVAGYIFPGYGMSAERMEPGDFFLAMRGVDHGGAAFSWGGRPVLRPSIDKGTPAAEILDSYADGKLHWLGWSAHPQTALRLSSCCAAAGMGASSISQNASKASGERYVVEASAISLAELSSRWLVAHCVSVCPRMAAGYILPRFRFHQNQTIHASTTISMSANHGNVRRKMISKTNMMNPMNASMLFVPPRFCCRSFIRI